MPQTYSKQSKEEAENIQKLVLRCAKQETEALREFFRIYSQDIYNFPIKVFHLDEDQASDFFLYAFEKLRTGNRFASFQGRSRFRTWFYTVLRNLVIDWMRTVRELETVSLKSQDTHEKNETSLIENVADPRSLSPGSDAKEQLSAILKNLPIELRSMLKLSYLFYFHFDAEEIAYIAKVSKQSEEEVLQKIAQLKNSLTSKSLKNLEALDKITSLYLNIRELKQKKYALEEELKRYTKEASPWNAPDQGEIERLSQLIQKKERQREKLLEKKERGNFIVRTPHKEIASLLGISEGSVSVQLNRIAEKVRKERTA